MTLPLDDFKVTTMTGPLPEPQRMNSLAGKPYRPSNGTEGDIFTAEFCANCTRHEDFTECDIALRSFAFSIGDDEYPEEWQYDSEGNPTCTAFNKPAPTEADRKYMEWLRERDQQAVVSE